MPPTSLTYCDCCYSNRQQTYRFANLYVRLLSAGVNDPLFGHKSLNKKTEINIGDKCQSFPILKSHFLASTTVSKLIGTNNKKIHIACR